MARVFAIFDQLSLSKYVMRGDLVLQKTPTAKIDVIVKKKMALELEYEGDTFPMISEIKVTRRWQF